MSKKIVWSSEVTASMLKGWSDDAVAELCQALDEAVEQALVTSPTNSEKR